MSIRLSLLSLLCLVSVIGGVIGMAGRFWFADNARYVRTSLEDGTTVIAFYRSTRSDCPPDYLVFIPAGFTVATDFGTSRTIGKAVINGELVNCDLISVSHAGQLSYNGKRQLVRPGSRVFICMDEGTMVPMNIGDYAIRNVSFHLVKQVFKTSFYSELEPILMQESSKRKERWLADALSD